MADGTKLVANRQSAAREVGAALEVHGVGSVDKVRAILYPDGEPRSLTLQSFMGVLVSALARESAAIGAADQALAEELADDEGFRSARDQAKAELRDELSSAQMSVQGAYGAKIAAAYQLAGPFPDANDLLINRARTAVSKLRAGAPSARPKEGRSVDFRKLASSLDEAATKYQSALDDVKREEREGQQALKARDAAIAKFEPVYSGIASIASGWLELSGNAELAERVKPTARRRAGLEGGTEPEGGESPAEPTGPTPTSDT